MQFFRMIYMVISVQMAISSLIAIENVQNTPSAIFQDENHNRKIETLPQEEFEVKSLSLDENHIVNEQAEKLFINQEFEKAIPLFKNLTEQFPDNDDYFYKLGLSYSRTNQWDKASKALEKTIELLPSQVDAKVSLGYVYLHQEKAEQSKELFLSVLKQSPDYLDAKTGLDLAEKKLHDKINENLNTETEKEIPITKEMQKDQVNNINNEAVISEANQLFESQEFEKAIPLYEQLTIQFPDNENYHYKLGVSYSRINQWNKAITALQKALELFPSQIDASLALGFVYLHLGEPEKSKELFNSVLRISPDYLDAQEGLKLAENRIKDDDVKKQDKETKKEENDISVKKDVKKNQLNEGEAQVLISQANKLFESKEFEKAIPLYEKLTAQFPDNDDYYYKLGLSYSRTKQWDKAIKTLQKTLELLPSQVDAQVTLGYVYLSIEEPEKSKELFAAVLKQTPDYNDAKDGIKLADERIRDKKEGKITKNLEKDALLSSKQKEEEKTPKKTDWAIFLIKDAEIFEKENKYRQAIAIYEQLSMEFPLDADYLFKLGKLHSRANRRPLGIVYMHLALDIEPKNEDIRTFLAYEYLYEKDFETALALFQITLVHTPKYADAIAGLGRVEALRGGCSFISEYYYREALFHDPKNFKALLYLSQLLLSEKRFHEAEWVYSEVLVVEPNDIDLQWAWFRIKSNTHPALFLDRNISQEREKEKILVQGEIEDKFVAELDYSDKHIAYVWPINDCLVLSSGLRYSLYKQISLINPITTFSAQWVTFNFSSLWIYNKNLSFASSFSVQSERNHDKDAILFTNRKILYQPGLIMKFEKEKYTIVFAGVISSLFAKNFDNFTAGLITESTLLGSYIYRFEDTRFVGSEAAYIYYSGRVPNRQRQASLWAQTGVGQFKENLSIRYQFDWRGFDKVIPDYYSFRRQATHWLNATFVKKLPYFFFVELEYWHGWRTTVGGNQQITTLINPITPNAKQVIQINKVFLRGGKRFSDRFELSAIGSYYRDTQDYTVWAANITLNFLF